MLGNGVIEVNKDYEYKDFIDLAGNIDNVTVPPNTKILIETIDNKTYVVLGDKIPLTGLKNLSNSLKDKQITINKSYL